MNIYGVLNWSATTERASPAFSLSFSLLILSYPLSFPFPYSSYPSTYPPHLGRFVEVERRVCNVRTYPLSYRRANPLGYRAGRFMHVLRFHRVIELALFYDRTFPVPFRRKRIACFSLDTIGSCKLDK